MKNLCITKNDIRLSLNFLSSITNIFAGKGCKAIPYSLLNNPKSEIKEFRDKRFQKFC